MSESNNNDSSSSSSSGNFFTSFTNKQKQETEQTTTPPQREQPKSGVDFLRNIRNFTTQTNANPYQFDQTAPPPEYLELEEEGSSRVLERAMSNVGIAYIGSLGIGALNGVYSGFKYGERGSFKVRLNSILNHAGTKSIKLANSIAAGLLTYHLLDIGLYFLTNPEKEKTTNASSEKVQEKRIEEDEDYKRNMRRLFGTKYYTGEHYAELNGLRPKEEELLNLPEEEPESVFEEINNPVVHSVLGGIIAGILYQTPAPFVKIVRGSLIGGCFGFAYCIYTGRFDLFTPLENNTWKDEWVRKVVDKTWIGSSRFIESVNNFKTPSGKPMFKQGFDFQKILPQLLHSSTIYSKLDMNNNNNNNIVIDTTNLDNNENK
ncbi:hypothetical protein ABK040_014138 [Willaertia magna]